jgi:hypothetical protein
MANREGRTQVEMCAKGFTAHIGATPTMDLKAFQGFQVAYYKAFSDSMTVVEDFGGRLQSRLERLHKDDSANDYMGIPASGK